MLIPLKQVTTTIQLGNMSHQVQFQYKKKREKLKSFTTCIYNMYFKLTGNKLSEMKVQINFQEFVM